MCADGRMICAKNEKGVLREAFLVELHFKNKAWVAGLGKTHMCRIPHLVVGAEISRAEVLLDELDKSFTRLRELNG